jgi:hypothetical protein
VIQEKSSREGTNQEFKCSLIYKFVFAVCISLGCVMAIRLLCDVKWVVGEVQVRVQLKNEVLDDVLGPVSQSVTLIVNGSLYLAEYLSRIHIDIDIDRPACWAPEPGYLPTRVHLHLLDSSLLDLPGVIHAYFY